MKTEEYYNSLDKRTKEYKEYKLGLGDKIAKVTDSLKIKKCKGCEERQQTLNIVGHQLEYFFKKHRPKDFIIDDRKLWDEFINRENQNDITQKQQKLIIRLLKDVLNMSVAPCNTCSPKIWLKYIKMINIIYNHK